MGEHENDDAEDVKGEEVEEAPKKAEKKRKANKEVVEKPKKIVKKSQ